MTSGRPIAGNWSAAAAYLSGGGIFASAGAAVRHILTNDIAQSEFARNTWVCKPELGTTKAEMLASTYWVHVAKQLRRGDHLEVLSADSAWYAEFIVRASTDLEIVVGELHYVEFDAIAARDVAEYEVKFAGPIAKWRITRLADKVVVKDGMTSRDACTAWLKNPVLEVPDLQNAA